MNTENEETPVAESDSSPSLLPPPYIPEQRILCKDLNNDNQVYEAIVKKVRCVKDGEWSFFVHYLGWNSRWDRWVSKEDILVDTPDTRKLHLKEVPARKRKKETESGSSGGRKKKSESNSTLSYYQDCCELPFTLKTILVEEYDQITRQGREFPLGDHCENVSKPARNVHHLPAKVTIKQVLQHYQRKRGGTNETEEKQLEVHCFCEGLEKLFEEALPVCLLYPQERAQYEAILQAERFHHTRLSEIYGCEFLLRLMVRLPILLQAEPKRESSLKMGPLLADLIVLLQKNRQACFKGSYCKPKNNELLDWEATLSAINTQSDAAKLES